VACVRRSESPWFTGPFGFVLEDAYELPFEPCAGQQGFFEIGRFTTPAWAKVGGRHFR
jgi:hypothetical protein